MSEPSGANSPYLYFISYAREDEEPSLTQFFVDLKTTVRGLTTHPVDAIGFHDTGAIPPGESWPTHLEWALCNCMAFIPIFSSRYFTREACGREWELFRRRLASQTAAGRPIPPLIIPVHWLPSRNVYEALSAEIQKIQYSHEEFGKRYAEKGARYLLQTKAKEYQRFVIHFSERLVNAIDRNRLLATTPPLRLADVPNAFLPELTQGSAVLPIRTSSGVDEKKLDAGRAFDVSREDFLSRVETVLRLRNPKSVARRMRASGLAAEYLEVSVPEDDIAPIYPLGAVEHGVTSEILQAFLEDVDAGYRRSDRGLISTLVYGGEPPPEDLVQKARAQRVRLVSFVQYQGLIDFRGYVAKQTKKLEEDPLYPPALYVHQRMVQLESREEIHDALAQIRRWLGSDGPSFILVLGDFGTGKTFLLHELARQLGQDHNSPVPVLLRIRSLEKGRSLDMLLAQHFALEQMEEFTPRRFRYMLEQGRIALLFDGFDELALRVTYERAADHFDTLLQAAGGAAKVVVTSRRQHFLTDEQARNLLGRRVEMLPGHRISLLQPFNEEQIRHFLTTYCKNGEKVDERLDLIKRIKDLKGLAHNPRMLGFIAELTDNKMLFEREIKAGAITSASLYRLLLERWIKYEFNRLNPKGAPRGLSEDHLWRAVTMLALRLWQKTEPFVRLDELAEEVAKVIQALSELDSASAAFQVGTGTLLVRDEDGNFSFLHQSILEWLVAKKAAEEIRGGALQVVAIREMSPLMADFLRQLIGEEEASLWANRMLTSDTGEKVKKNALLLLRGRELPDLPRTGGAVDLAAHDLKGKDLSGHDLTGANLWKADLTAALLIRTRLTSAKLRDARLVNADLTGASLQSADLSGADLSGARLLGADLQNARFEGARMRRAKLLGATRDLNSDFGDTFGAALSASHPVDFVLSATWPSSAVAFSPNGEFLASAEGLVIRLLEGRSGKEIRRLEGHEKEIWSVTFNHNGSAIATGSRDRVVRVFETETGRLLWRFQGHQHEVMSVAFSPDGRLLATGSYDQTIYLLDAATGQKIQQFTGHFLAVACVAFNPDGKILASSSYDQTVGLWELESGRRLPRRFQEHRNWVRCLAFSPDGASLACGTDDRIIFLYDVATGFEIRRFTGPGGWIRSLAFTPDGKKLACGSQDQTVRLFDVAAGHEVHRFKESGGYVTSVAVSKEVLACGSEEESVRLFDLEIGHELGYPRAPDNSAMSAAFSPDGLTVACGLRNRTVLLLETATGREIRRLTGFEDRAAAVAFNPNGQTLATGCHDRTVRIHDIATGAEARRLAGHNGKVWCLAFSPDGQCLATGGQDQIVRLFDPGDGREIRRYEGHRDWVLSVAFSPDGQFLASGSLDNTVRVWNVQSGEEVRLLYARQKEGVGVSFSPDGRYLAASSSHRSILLFSMESGDEIRKLEGHDDWILSLAFSPDGNLLASGSLDDTVRLWDVETGGQIRRLVGHQGRVMSVSFCPDGKYLVSSADDNSVRLWEVSSGDCLAVLGLFAEGWAAFAPDGSYKYGGIPAGSFWHVVKLCRFEPGELDPYIPRLRLPDEASFLDHASGQRSPSS